VARSELGLKFMLEKDIVWVRNLGMIFSEMCN